MHPPTSMCTGAVSMDKAAARGMPHLDRMPLQLDDDDVDDDEDDEDVDEVGEIIAPFASGGESFPC